MSRIQLNVNTGGVLTTSTHEDMAAMKEHINALAMQGVVTDFQQGSTMWWCVCGDKAYNASREIHIDRHITIALNFSGASVSQYKLLADDVGTIAEDVIVNAKEELLTQRTGRACKILADNCIQVAKYGGWDERIFCREWFGIGNGYAQVCGLRDAKTKWLEDILNVVILGWDSEHTVCQATAQNLGDQK